MMTKEKFCRGIKEMFALSENIEVDYIKDHHIYMSSKLAIAMEYLGELTDQELQKYAASRAGLMVYYTAGIVEDQEANGNMLTVREILEMLPD